MTSYLFARWIVPVDRPAFGPGFVAFEDGRMTAVDALESLPPSLQAGFDLRTAGDILSPGLINTHAHLELSFPQPVPLEGSMADWLSAVVSLTREHSSDEAKQARCKAGVAELLATGTTGVNDISSDGASLSPLMDAGIRAVVSLEFFHPGFEALQLEALLSRYAAFQEQVQSHPLVSLGLSPHSPYNVSPRAWRAAVEALSPALIHTHLAESLEETRWVTGQPSGIQELHQGLLGRVFSPQPLEEGPRPVSPVDYAARHGLLADNTVLAHGVYASPEDIRALSQAGARLAHCPRSNGFLQGRTLDWKLWAESGIPVGLGTDSRLSADSLDLRAEARVARAQHGWSAAQAVDHLTRQGATVMGWQHLTGSLTPGKSADFVLWRTAAGAAPSPEEALLAEGTQVQAVFIAGQQKEGVTLFVNRL